MYIYVKDNIVWEFVPAENPELPGVPIEERYPAAFIQSLIHVEEAAGIEYGYIYDPETGEFSAPPEPEPVPERDALPDKAD